MKLEECPKTFHLTFRKSLYHFLLFAVTFTLFLKYSHYLVYIDTRITKVVKMTDLIN